MGNAEKQTKQKIMEIAKEHFSRYGYAGTNLEAIGKPTDGDVEFAAA